MTRKKKCDFRMPPVKKVEGTPYKDRFVTYCSCGCTVFGNTEDECKASWVRHVNGELK